MTRTIRLAADSYRITDTDAVEHFVCTPTGYRPDYNAPNVSAEFDKCDRWEWRATKYAIGERAVLVSTTDVSPNAIRAGTKPHYRLSFDLDGVPGNTNPSIKHTSGWRGTTNDRSVDAHGVVTIRKIRALKNGDIAVTVS